MHIKYIIILFFIIVMTYIFWQYYYFIPSYDEKKIINVSTRKNKNRNVKKKDGLYAHFSQLVNRMPSVFEYPLYYLSHPKEYIIKPGEFVYIPKNWWHWVISFTGNDDYCFSCNHWFNEQLNNSTPYVGKFMENNDIREVINIFEQKVDKNKYNLKLWCDKSKDKITTLRDFISNKNNYTDCYMITLKAYEMIKQNLSNNNFFDEFKHIIKVPTDIQNKNIIETNFWLNKGNIDTGLHYDDFDGMLCVLSGYKIVTLFPPSDTKYLYPIEQNI